MRNGSELTRTETETETDTLPLARRQYDAGPSSRGWRGAELPCAPAVVLDTPACCGSVVYGSPGTRSPR